MLMVAIKKRRKKRQCRKKGGELLEQCSVEWDPVPE